MVASRWLRRESAATTTPADPAARRAARSDMVLVELAAEPATVTGGRAGPSYLSLPAGPAVGNAARCGATPQPAELAAETEAWLGLATCLMVRSAARCDAAPPSAGPMAERDVMVLRVREGEAAAVVCSILEACGSSRKCVPWVLAQSVLGVLLFEHLTHYGPGSNLTGLRSPRGRLKGHARYTAVRTISLWSL